MRLVALLLLCAAFGCADSETKLSSDSQPAAEQEAVPTLAPKAKRTVLLPLDRSQVYAYPPESIDTTVLVGVNPYHVRLRQYVSPDSSFSWQEGSYGEGVIDTFYYFDNEIDVLIQNEEGTVMSRTMRKQDFASVSGADFVEAANLSLGLFDRMLPQGKGVRFSVGVYVPDSDVGDYVWVEASADSVDLSVQESEGS